MNPNDAEFMKRLLATFKGEAEDHLSAIASGLLELEKVPDTEGRAKIIETVFREAHSLKGAARSVNLGEIVSICQSMENVFASLKRGEISHSSQLFDLLHRTVDCIGELVPHEKELSVSKKTEIADLKQGLDSAAAGRAVKEGPEGSLQEPEVAGQIKESGRKTGKEGGVTEERNGAREKAAGEESIAADIHPLTDVAAPAFSETVRISTTKLNSLLLQAEEMLSVKLATDQRAAELREMRKSLDLWKKETSRSRGQGTGGRKRGGRGAEGQGEGTDGFITTMDTRLTSLVKAAEYDHRSFGVMVDTLLNDMKKALMLPFSTLLDIFPKFVRDVSRDAGKKVEFTIDGGELEIDRRVMEEMKDPLIHLVRNCIDHGIEMPEEREKKKKPPCGNIRIAVVSRDNKIEISVSDDGRGIEAYTVKSAAVKRGIISQEEADRLSGEEALSLIFRSGVTTSPLITDLSGRGLGLAIVVEKVGKLNGRVSLDTKPEEGTLFKMVVPLTLATFRGVLVGVGEHFFVLPSINVERVARVKKEEIKTVENRETLSFSGQTVSLSRLADVLELQSGSRGQGPGVRERVTGRRDQDSGNSRPPTSGPRPLHSESRPPVPDPFFQVVVLGSAEKRMAFLVDEVVHEQEVLVKTLGRQLSRVRNIAGGTVLGNGKVVPILNVADLMKSAVKGSAAPVVSDDRETPRQGRSVLVVEDSITARTLLKNILESAGYEVKTTVDGADAFAALKTHLFDLVVSDIQMPRMDGFELVTRIRGDKKLADLPVVLVTALEAREDRERGIDVGANAYIVKSSFDQSNLLEVVGRLI